MKQTVGILLLAAGLALQCCDLVERPLVFGDARRDTGAGGGRSGTGGAETPGSGGDPGDGRRIYVSAVRSEASYDWQRDTAWDTAGYELVLYRIDPEAFADEGAAEGGERYGAGREIEEAVVLKTGRKERVSAAPDLHHIVGGHLYTEYADSRGTTLKRDGNVIFTVPGQELLAGILELDGSVYTLWRNRLGEGLVLRRDGDTVFSRERGSPVGGFSSEGHMHGGALFLQDSIPCFAYRQLDGGEESVFLVRGTDEVLAGRSDGTLTLDVTETDGTIYRIARKDKGIVFSCPGSEMSSAEVAEDSESWIFTLDGLIAAVVSSPGTGLHILMVDGRMVRLRTERGMFFISEDGKTEVLGEETTAGCYIPSRQCVTFMDGRLLAAMTARGGTWLQDDAGDGGTPEKKAAMPMLVWGSRRLELPFNGFLTGVKVHPAASPPS